MSDQDNELLMTPSRPYLLRGFYEWIVDNGCTPYLVVNAEYPEVKVPVQYIEGGKIVLNIAEVAVKNLFMDNEAVSFSARFSGRALDVYVPISAAVAIYAKENGRGMVFGEDEQDTTSNHTSSSDGTTSKHLHAVSTADSQQQDKDDDDPPPSGGGKDGKPSLHIVK